ncbi:MAG TPA: DUF429 domain-containing protein [Blastocatellia bacterium]|nr:DUF429 domain-containing protein [Blastocatellia bacterium]
MFETIYGVDFSGARLAGQNTWVARIERKARRSARPAYQLTALSRLEKLCGTAERAVALAHLVRLIMESQQALWALDFPFGFPVEVLGPGAEWPTQFDFLHEWSEDDYGIGLECLRRAKALGGPGHIRRLTDIEEKAPFDPYHYRIIYQTFYGMRDVLGPLRRRRHTAILPFQYRRLSSARRVLVEACPASTLKRLGLPHQNYKQPEGGPLVAKRLRTRRAILDGLSKQVAIGDTHRRVMMRNGGGDALDAVIAALGAARAWQASDHRLIARHPRYPHEGRLYV